MRGSATGFTLIELLIVVVIIGILAAIAIPKFGATRGKAYIAAMKSDLRNMVTAQESYFVDYFSYTSNLGTVYSTSQGVTFSIQNATVTGWDGTASHSATAVTCTIAIGAAAGTGPAGAPICS